MYKHCFCPTALAAAIAMTSAVDAQWSSDASLNLALADESGEQVQPKIQPTADGGCYVSWYDNSSGGYDVYLQRLDADGNEQWAHDGVLIADRGFSSTQDYGLSIDSAGNALLTFRDDRFSGTQITATLVDPSGSPSWGATGIQLTNTTDSVAAPKIAGTTDGNVIVAWTQDADTVVQKLDSTGTAQWGAGVTLTPGAGSYSASDLHAGQAGTAVLSIVHQTGGFGSPRHVLAQKFDTDGSLLWGAGHVTVYDGGSLQFGNFPTFVPDGSGGGVFSWYSVSPLQSHVQHVLSNGSLAFAANGVPVSTDATRIRVSPSADFNPLTGELVVAWTEQNALQSMFGVYAQKLDASGNRLWGAEGKTLVALGTNELTGVRTLAYGTGALVSWVASAGIGSDSIQACRLGDTGSFVVSPAAAASTASDKSRLAAALSSERFAMLVWQDARDDASDVYGQSYLPDGTLGQSACAPITLAARQGGSNPDVYDVQNPLVLGDVFEATVDAATAGQVASVLFALDSPFSFTLGGGQVVLTIDGGSGELFTGAGLTPSSSAAGVDSYSLGLPMSAIYCGVELYSQAIVFGSPPFELSNSQDLSAGF